MKLVLIGIAFMAFSVLPMMAQNVNTDLEISSAADFYWKSIPKLETLKTSTYKSTTNFFERTVEEQVKIDNDRINSIKAIEIWRILYWDWVCKFWEIFPHDVRKYSLLNIPPPNYFVDIDEGAKALFEKRSIIPLDTIAKKKWRQKYESFRNELLSSDLPEVKKKNFLRLELREGRGEYIRSKSSDRFDIETWTGRLLEFERKYKNDISSEELYGLVSSVDRIFTGRSEENQFGLSQKDLKEFINTLNKSGVPAFQIYADQKWKFISLNDNPFYLKTKTVDSKPFDIKKLGARIMLVDCWNVTCSGCIEKMPEIKNVYEKYNKLGFEVVSVCFSVTKKESEEKERAIQIQKKIGADWPLIFLSSKAQELGGQIRNMYGIKVFPTLFLLDEEGKLLHYNNKIKSKNGLEKLVNDYLEGKSNKNKKGK